MATLKVSGIPGLDGEYACDLSSFTNREWHEIKKQTGLAGQDFFDAVNKGDNDVMVGLAITVLGRHGKKDVADEVWDADVGKLTFDFTDEEEQAGEEDAGPPEPETIPDTSGGSETGSDGETDSSGETSPESSDSQEPILRAIGGLT